MSRNLSIRVALVSLAAVLATGELRAENPFDPMLKRLPDQTNGLLMVDVQALHNSPLGKRQRWAEKRRQSYVTGVSSLPPATRRLVVGVQFDPTTLEPTWKIGVAEVAGKVDIRQMATRSGASLDRVADRSVLVTPQGGYVVGLNSPYLGGMQPANRQALSRWLGFLQKNNKLVLSDYLRQAAGQLDDDHEMVMALDLTDVFDRAGVRKRLQKAKELKGDVDYLADLIAGMKGITLRVGVGRVIQGELKVQFSQRAELPPETGKLILLRALDAQGAHIEDLEDWTARTEGDTLVLSGKLTEAGVRQLISPVDPSSTAAATEPAGSAQLIGQDAKAVASQRYYKSVTTLLEDLKQRQATSFNKLAYWHYDYSKKIDALPLLNVDPELVTYGASVSETLRAMANQASNTGRTNKLVQGQASVGVVETPTTYYSAYGYNRYGGAWGYQYNTTELNLVDNFSQVRSLMAQNATSEAAMRQDTWKNIDDSSSAIRRKMTAKYNVEF